MMSTGYVCRRCCALLKPVRPNLTSTAARLQSRPAHLLPCRTYATTTIPPSANLPPLPKSSNTPKAPSKLKTAPRKQQQPAEVEAFWSNDVTVASADHAALVAQAQALGAQILGSQAVPAEDDVFRALELIRYAALQLGSAASAGTAAAATGTAGPSNVRGFLETVGGLERAAAAAAGPAGPALAEPSSKPSPAAASSISISTNLLSYLAYKIIKHPPVFISPKLLETYVAVQCSLRRIDSLPEIFDLYAHKPVPVPDSSPLAFKNPSPNSPSHAIPESLAQQALGQAIAQKKLTLALDIISSTYATPAFRRNKFIRKALPAVTGLGLTPVVAVPLAKTFATQSLTMDQDILAIYTFFGILTYVGTVTCLGFIALTTYNDHMERVTWIPGMPLRNRWMREEERAAADKLALAWGFKERERRGEEEGEEWELLRTWCGYRGMILDATELMDGME
jgi:hypothetical protein